MRAANYNINSRTIIKIPVYIRHTLSDTINDYDLRQPMRNLKDLLQERLQIDLSEHTFVLDSGEALVEGKSLADQIGQDIDLIDVTIGIETEVKSITMSKTQRKVDNESYSDEPSPPGRLANARRRRRKQMAKTPSDTSIDYYLSSLESTSPKAKSGTRIGDCSSLNDPTLYNQLAKSTTSPNVPELSDESIYPSSTSSDNISGPPQSNSDPNKKERLLQWLLWVVKNFEIVSVQGSHLNSSWNDSELLTLTESDFTNLVSEGSESCFSINIEFLKKKSA